MASITALYSPPQGVSRLLATPLGQQAHRDELGGADPELTERECEHGKPAHHAGGATTEIGMVERSTDGALVRSCDSF
jgi:hypothetical protein